MNRFRTSVEILGEIKGKNKCIIINMDQTPIFFDNSPKHTITERGVKEVILRKTTGGKQRCTFMLTVSSDGSKFPPYIIYKSNRKTPILNPSPDYAIINHNTKGKKYNNFFFSTYYIIFIRLGK